MAISMRNPARRPRRHGVCLEPADRRGLERAGWRTMLDYRENHVRGRDGRLVEVEVVWIAEAERYDGVMVVASATGASVEEAWAALRADIDCADGPFVMNTDDELRQAFADFDDGRFGNPTD